MKLLVCFIVALCAAGSLSEPLLRRRCLLGAKVGLLGAILGGGGYSDRVETRTVQAAPAAAPAPAPSVNVNVQNVYNKEDRQQINNDNKIGAVNNNYVNNDLKYRQNINNRAESNVRNNQRADNRVVNNNYRPYTECQTGECE